MKYASGKWAHACCERCGLTYDYLDIKKESETGLRVCPECFDPEHPQDHPERYMRKLPDAEALRHPSGCGEHIDHCVQYFVYDDYLPNAMGSVGQYLLDKYGLKVVLRVGDDCPTDCLVNTIYDDYPPTPSGDGEYLLDKDAKKLVQIIGDCS